MNEKAAKILMSIICIGLIIGGVAWILVQTIPMMTGARIEATVVGRVNVGFNQRNEQSWLAILEFELDGETYEVRSRRSWRVQNSTPRNGETMTIWVDSNNPENVLSDGITAWPFILTGTGIIIATIMLVALKRSRSKSVQNQQNQIIN